MNVARRWLPVVLWSAVILAVSSDWFSTDNTGAFLRSLLGRDLPWALHVVLRKLGHLTGYAILGALALHAALADFRRPVLASFAIVILVASIDEWHQATTRSRTGTPWDVLLDVVGGAIAIGLLVQKWRPR